MRSAPAAAAAKALRRASGSRAGAEAGRPRAQDPPGRLCAFNHRCSAPRSAPWRAPHRVRSRRSAARTGSPSIGAVSGNLVLRQSWRSRRRRLRIRRELRRPVAAFGQARRLRELARKGAANASLVAIEPAPSLFQSLVFGLSGDWFGDDGECLRSAEGWRSTLTRSGLSRVRAEATAHGADLSIDIVARAPEASSASGLVAGTICPAAEVVIVHDGPDDFAVGLKHALTQARRGLPAGGGRRDRRRLPGALRQSLFGCVAESTATESGASRPNASL